jgi:Cys-rich protein (TIGR01571 family)
MQQGQMQMPMQQGQMPMQQGQMQMQQGQMPQQNYGQPAPAFQQQYAVQVAVVQQQYTIYRMWSDGLCDCFNDCSSCLLAFFFPPYLFARNAEKTGNSSFNLAFIKYFIPWATLVVLSFIFGSSRAAWVSIVVAVCNILCVVFNTMLRTYLRSKFQINGDTCEDCCLSCFCRPCALAQESRHVNRWLLTQQQQGQPMQGQPMQGQPMYPMQGQQMSPMQTPMTPMQGPMQGQTGQMQYGHQVAIPVTGQN